MLKWFKYRICIILLVAQFFPFVLHAQYYLYNDAPIQLEATFSRHSLEASPKQTFFNVLKIKNKANKSETFTLNITVPQEWSVIGQEKTELTIAPLDSMIIPIRVAIGGRVRGDIGYSVIASLTDARGNTIRNEYCFVKIPRQTDLNIRYLNRIIYLDPVSYTAEFSVEVKNRGNREELVNFIFDGKRKLGIGKQNLPIISEDITVPPYTDSTFTFQVELKQDEYFGRSLFALNAKSSTVDTSFTNILWFNLASSTIKNIIPANEKPLVVELMAQGLLKSDQKPTTIAIIEGKTLFKKSSEIYYYYRNYSSETKEDLYKYNRMYLGSRVGNFQLEFGDSYRAMESSMSGRGGYFAYNGKTIKSEIIANRNERSQMDNLGASLSYYFAPRNFVKIGSTYNKSSLLDFNSKLGFAGFGINFLKRHSLFLLGSYNQTQHGTEVINPKGYGAEISYNSNYRKFSSFLKARYGNKYLFSPNGGKLEILSNISWNYNTKNILLISYNENRNSTFSIIQPSQNQVSSLTSRMGSVRNTYLISPDLNVYAGPAIENYHSEGIIKEAPNEYYSSIGFKLIAGARFRNSSGTATLSPQLEIARTNALHNPYAKTDTSSNLRKWFNYQFFSLTFRSRSFLILAFYTSGPRSSIDQLNYLATKKPTRRLQFMPTYDRFIYKDIISTQVGLSYSNDMVARSSYTNITGQMFWYMPKNWTFRILSVYSLQSRTNPQDLVETYQNFYLEAGLRKEFDIQHPRVKYHNVNIVFFKDFNGNYIQEDNEPGIKNVLVNIEKENIETIGYIPGDFYNADLLSDNLGRITLDRVPSGNYKLIYNPIGKDAGSFTKAIEELTIKIDKNKVVYIPFVEKNKVFGKIVLYRSRLSGLGKLDLSNIRITATDSKGRTFTALTDKNGEFILYAPVTDQYTVNVNNIFYENFDLRQNNFKVQFNGYKQFEVNFVFDEKIRRINFSPSSQDAQLASILQVRRTNLKGTVKDASTLNAIRARVNLINTKTNSVVTSMYSNSASGDYNISFMADDNYLLEVLAEGYWYHSENLNLNQVTTFLNVTKDVILKPIAIGTKIELNIKFEINKTDLTAESVAELNRLISLLKDNGNIKIEVQGHSDDLEALSNTQISEDRAKKVARYLIENGFSNIQIRGFGNTVPISSNDTEQGREANRRVEIEVVSK